MNSEAFKEQNFLKLSSISEYSGANTFNSRFGGPLCARKLKVYICIISTYKIVTISLDLIALCLKFMYH